MKTLPILLLLAVAGQFTYAHNTHYVQERLFGDKIKKALEKFKETMKTGNEAASVPKLDPLDREHYDIKVDEKLITAEGKVSNIHVEGLSDYTVLSANYEVLKSTLVISMAWSNVKGHVSYDLNATAMNQYPIYGAGGISFEAQKFQFATRVKVSLDIVNKKIKLKEFSGTKVSLEKLQLEISGLFNDEELSQRLGPLISEMVPETLVEYQDEITSQLNIIMLKLGTELLEKIDIWNIISL